MNTPTNWRAWLAFAHDLTAATLAWIAIYWLRFNLDVREPYLPDVAWTLAWIVPAAGRRSSSRSDSIAGCGASRVSSTCSGSCWRRGLARC